MKTGFRIIIVLIVILGVLFVGRNIIAKFSIEKGVEAATGLPLNIKKLDLGLVTTHIGINGLSLFNPKEFGDEVMFHASEIFVDYNLGAILKGKIHLEDIRLDFDQLVIIKNEQGQTNLEALKPKTKKDQPSQEAEKKDDAGSKKSPQIQIDHLSVKIGKIIYKDYSQGGDPVIKEYQVNISEELNDVMDPNSLLNFIAAKAMAKTALSSLGDFNVGGDMSVPQGAIDTLKSQVEMFKGAIKFPSQE